MKCGKCGIELSDRVCVIHQKNCKIGEAKIIKVYESSQKDVTPKEDNYKELKLENPTKYTLEQLLQMCLDNDNIKHSPSTIKRWKEERCLKELNL